MSRIDPVDEARLEGLMVEAEGHRQAFMDAAASTIGRMQTGIVRDYPEFYSWRIARDCGVRRVAWLARRTAAGFPMTVDRLP